MDRGGTLAVLLVVPVLAIAPGAVVAMAATSAHTRMRRVALLASPAVTFGLIGTAVSWSGLFGWRWSARSILAFEAVVVIGALALRAVAWHRAGRPARSMRLRAVRDRVAVHRADVAGLGLAALGSVTVGFVMFHRAAAPLGWDSMNHAFMARRIMDSGGALPVDACVTGSVLPHVACTFYPLTPHVLWVQLSELSGRPLSVVMLTTVVALMPAYAVSGTFGILRLTGAGTVVAMCGSFLCAIIGPMWPSLVTGRLTVDLGAALAPSVCLLVWLAMRSSGSTVQRIVAGAGLGGLALAHTYDVIAAFFLGIGLLIARRDPVSWHKRMRHLLVIGGSAAVFVAPQIPLLLGASGERAISQAGLPGQPFEALQRFAFAPGQYLGTVVAPAVQGAEGRLPPLSASWAPALSMTMSVLIVVGLLACLHPRFRWGRPFAIAHILTLATSILINTGTGTGRDLVASLFYGDPRRPMWSDVVAPAVLCLTGGVAVLWVLVAWFPIVAGRARVTASRVVLPVLVTSLVTASLVALPDSHRTPDRFAGRSLPANPAYADAAHWILRHGSGVVADDTHRDYITWLNADFGIPVLRGMVPLKGAALADWNARTKVWNALIASSPSRRTCLHDPYDVRWVVVGDQHMPGGSRTWSMARLRASPYLTPSFEQEGVYVFAVDHLCH